MKDEWLESLGLACMALMAAAVGIGLCGFALLVQAASSITGEAFVGIGLWAALSLAAPFVNDLLILLAGVALGSSPQPGLRMGGLLLFGGAVARMFGN